MRSVFGWTCQLSVGRNPTERVIDLPPNVCAGGLLTRYVMALETNPGMSITRVRETRAGKLSEGPISDVTLSLVIVT